MVDLTTPTPPRRPPTGREHRQFLRVMGEFVQRSEQVEKLDGGYAVAFPNTRSGRARAHKVAMHWRRSLPAFGVELSDPRQAGPVWLRITGDADGEAYLRDLITESGQFAGLSQYLSSQLSISGRVAARASFALRRASSPIRALPDFLLIGAAKCGSSSLYSGICQHPSILRALRKEIYFFDHAFDKGMGYYRAHFPTVSEKRRVGRSTGMRCLTGEATPCYLFHPHVPKRVAANLPHVKLIAVLRNPVDRAYSEYSLKLRTGNETGSFAEAIDAETERTDGELDKMLADESYFSHPRWHFSYRARGVYADQLARWWEVFPREQLLVLASEDFFTSRAATFAKIMQFLGLPDWQPEELAKGNAVPYPDMDPQVRRRLVEYFAPHNRRLGEMLGRQLDWDR